MFFGFYYVIFDYEKKLYVKDFDLYSIIYTDNLIDAFRFLDKECASAFLNDILSTCLTLRLKKVILREYDVICRR